MLDFGSFTQFTRPFPKRFFYACLGLFCLGQLISIKAIATDTGPSCQSSLFFENELKVSPTDSGSASFRRPLANPTDLKKFSDHLPEAAAERNPYSWISDEQAFLALMRFSRISQNFLSSKNPLQDLNQLDLHDLRLLLDIVVKSHLRNQLKKDQVYSYYRALDNIQLSLTEQINRRSVATLPEHADDLIAALNRTLHLKGNYLSKQDRTYFARMAGKLAPFVEDSIVDLVAVYKHIRFQPSRLELKLLVAKVKERWEQPYLKLVDIEMFANLASVVPEIRSNVLKRLLLRFHYNLNIGNPAAYQGYSMFLWSLVQLNPIYAYEFSTRPVRYLPEPNSEKAGTLRYNQLSFANAYFNLVLKRPTGWLKTLLEPLKVFDRAVQVKTTEEQKELAPLIKMNFPDMIEEYRIPETPFVVDFFLPKERIIIEVDGDVHFMTDDAGSDSLRLKDLRRDEILKAMGFHLIRITNEEAKNLMNDITAQEFQSRK